MAGLAIQVGWLLFEPQLSVRHLIAPGARALAVLQGLVKSRRHGSALLFLSGGAGDPRLSRRRGRVMPVTGPKAGAGRPELHLCSAVAIDPNFFRKPPMAASPAVRGCGHASTLARLTGTELGTNVPLLAVSGAGSRLAGKCGADGLVGVARDEAGPAEVGEQAQPATGS
jgi:hypothetical protein